jgi:hypothetical protein
MLKTRVNIATMRCRPNGMIQTKRRSMFATTTDARRSAFANYRARGTQEGIEAWQQNRTTGPGPNNRIKRSVQWSVFSGQERERSGEPVAD